MDDTKKTKAQLIAELEELREEKQIKFLEKLFEPIPHPFYVIDVNDYILIMANSACKFGSLKENSTCYELTHKRNKPCKGAEHICPVEEIKRKKTCNSRTYS